MIGGVDGDTHDGLWNRTPNYADQKSGFNSRPITSRTRGRKRVSSCSLEKLPVRRDLQTPVAAGIATGNAHWRASPAVHRVAEMTRQIAIELSKSPIGLCRFNSCRPQLHQHHQRRDSQC